MCKIDKHVKCAKKCKIKNPLKTHVFFMILSLLEGPYRKKHINFCSFLMIWNLPAASAASADLPDQVSFATARDLPSTRAGGQDDGSLNKLPQISGG